MGRSVYQLHALKADTTGFMMAIDMEVRPELRRQDSMLGSMRRRDGYVEQAECLMREVYRVILQWNSNRRVRSQTMYSPQ